MNTRPSSVSEGCEVDGQGRGRSRSTPKPVLSWSIIEFKLGGKKEGAFLLSTETEHREKHQSDRWLLGKY